jgi:hypothetical protein
MDHQIRQMAIFTVAHEVAHQYFAGLVGSDCRGEPAVDEPLAQFAAGEYVRHRMGEAAGRRLMDANVKLNYGIYRMLGGADLPAARPVRDFPSLLAYAAIVYGKAPYFYPALRRELGARRFDAALRTAVERSRFKIVSIREWLQALEEGAGGSGSGVTPLARRWFFERHGDEDLGVDESGDAVLAAMAGEEGVAQLKRSLALFGMQPRDLLRALLGHMLAEGEGGEKAAAPGSGAGRLLEQLLKKER